jgi:hypothetical protein
MKLKHYMKELGLTSALSKTYLFDMMAEPISELRHMYLTVGARALCVYLWTHFQMHISR